MEGWILATSKTPKELADALRDALPKHGLRVVETTTTNATVANIYGTSEGAHLIVAYARPNRALARALSVALDVPARLLELTLEDTTVSATLTEFPDGAASDLDNTALELLNDWNEGESRKFYSESYPALAEALLHLDYGSEGRPAAIVRFEPAVSKRVATLLQQVQNGSRWERTTIGGQSAICVSGPGGTQISVLARDELAEFLAACGG